MITAGGADGLVGIRACLGTSATDPSPLCTQTIPVTLDATTFGATYATAPLGPGTVSLTTGDWTTSSTDAAVAGLSVTRALTTLSPATAPGAAGVFGPGWSASMPAEAGASDLTLADHFAQGYATLTSAEGDQSTYATAATSLPATFTGVGEAADGSVLKKVSTTSYTLADTDGTVTTWTLTAGAWLVTSVVQTGNEATTSFSYDASGRVTQILAPVPTGVTCTTLVTGCRALSLTYATSTTATGTTSGTWGNYTGLVSSISYTAYDPGTSAMNTTAVASYLYDNTGHLRAAWDPRVTPALKTTYDYDATGRLITLTPPGLNAWTLHYSTDGTHRVVDATRTDPANGAATTAVAYGIAISGTGTPLDLSAGGSNDPATWGQGADLPRVGAATFPASHVPAKDGTSGLYTPGAGDWPYADLSYQDVNGRTVNSATYGAGTWLISSSQYDATGNTTWSLDSNSRAEALSPTAATDGYVQALGSSVLRAAALATTTTYDSVGNVKTVTGPVHDATLAADPTVEVPQRLVTTTTYDEGAPSGGPYYQPTTTTTTPISVNGASTTAADVRITKNGYDPIDGASPTGLTSGWVLRTPTTTTTVMSTAVGGPAGATDLVSATLYDASGRVLQQRQPADATGTTAGTRTSVYYTTAANASVPACGSKPAWAGMLCQVGPAAQPTVTTIPTTVTTYGKYDLPATITETSGSTVRTTTNSYDSAGRAVSSRVSDNLANDSAVLDAFTDYDTTTGAVIANRSVTTGGTTVATASIGYDALGRVTSQTDGNTNTATSSYTVDGQLRTLADSQGTTTYTYDTSSEHRGLVTTIDAGIGSGVPSVTSASYDVAGTPTITYPNGVVASPVVDTAGTLQSLSYADSTSAQIAEWDPTYNAYGQQVTLNGPSASGGRTQGYTYDPAGRLTNVADTLGDNCTVRGYTLGVDSTRTAQSNWVGAAQTGCPTSAGTAASSSARTTGYDTYDRATSTTVTGAGAGSVTYTYDALGRTTAVPTVDLTGTSTISDTVKYSANDLVVSQTQTGGTTRTYTLDALRRLNSWTDTTGANTTVTTNHYDDASDSPAWTASTTSGTTTSTRNIVGPDGNLALNTTRIGAGAVTATLGIVDPHGDVFTTIPDTTNISATQVGTANDTDEFGVTLTTGAPAYNWVGAKQRTTDTTTGLVQMGVRLYNPTTGRFLSIDPVFGGNANPYTYPTDPINDSDLDGLQGKRLFDGAGGGGGGAAFRAWMREIEADGLKPTARRAASWAEQRPALGPGSKLFGKGPYGKGGWLNRGPLRFGWGWVGTRATGRYVVRIGYGWPEHRQTNSFKRRVGHDHRDLS